MAAIGRWGPVQAPGGRTEGAPCTFGLGLCDDNDVTVWHKEAKNWKSFAANLRAVVVDQWGNDTQTWPDLARYGELSWKDADAKLAGDLGFFDGAKVGTLSQIQRQLKLAMEAWAVALDQVLPKPVEPGPLVGYDASENPDDVPPVVPLPDLPNPLAGVSSALKIAAVGLVLVVAVVALRRK
ncbi:hypothetical protein [Nannocystis bainbridge]|uniref:Uncharacterized protein n=1 Tax=Nannocystis bainbridge TaxID=2995303 RepID=A0ABT5E598_9BACT|nr:hypothetical protein [Nannocystis bainbridge]MDC0719926.1 hypothetical protein [Nannocystis bainbridge]